MEDYLFWVYVFGAAVVAIVLLTRMSRSRNMHLKRAEGHLANSNHQAAVAELFLGLQAAVKKWDYEDGSTSIGGWKGQAQKIQDALQRIESIKGKVLSLADPADCILAWSNAIQMGGKAERKEATIRTKTYLKQVGHSIE